MIKEWWDYTLLMRASIATRVNFIMESVERPSCEPRGAQVIIIVSVAAPGVSHSGHLYYNTRMRKRNKDIRQAIETPLLGYSVVLLSLSCFLLLLWALIILVRIVLG